MTSGRRRYSVLLLLPLLLQLTGAGPAAAGHVGCGSVITTDTVLDSDVGPCPTGGLRVTVSGIVLDLNGHRVFGSPGPTDGLGIHLFRVSGVTVRNGTVSDFDAGVAIEGGEQNTVEFVNARDNIGRAGVTLGGEGIAILSSRNNQLYGNNVVNNGPFAGIGLYTEEEQHPRTTTGPSTGNLVDSNTITRNIIDPAGGTVNTQIAGIRAANNSTHNTYVNNRVTDNGLDGISLFRGSGHSVIRGNIVSGNGLFRTAARRGSGIIAFNEANNNLIEHNLVTGNGDNGISLRPTVTAPISGVVPGSMNNIVRFNTAIGNVARPWIPSPTFGPTADLHDGNPNCDNNQWLDNRYGTVSQPCAGDTP